jgi:hypothetical protein
MATVVMPYDATPVNGPSSSQSKRIASSNKENCNNDDIYGTECISCWGLQTPVQALTCLGNHEQLRTPFQDLTNVCNSGKYITNSILLRPCRSQKDCSCRTNNRSKRIEETKG